MAISSAVLRAVTASLYEWSLKMIPPDTKRALAAAQRSETQVLGRQTIEVMIESAAAAEDTSHLICTDVGIPTFSVRIGSRVTFEGDVRQPIVDGLADLVQGIQPPILKMVTNPLTHQRGHAGKGVPVITFDVIDGADYVDMICAPKAMGTGRWEALETFVYPSLEEIEKYVLDTVVRAGSQPCPPIVVGVGIGGTFDYAAKMAKEQVLRPMGQLNPEPVLAAMEERLLKTINQLGFGPMGTGGDTSAMAVHIDYCYGHGFTPVAVSLNCWINRRTHARIHADGRVERIE